MRLSHLLCALAAACTALPSAACAADPFHVKPIQLVIPFAPGDTGAMLRPFTDRMQEVLGQPVEMNDKPGAGGGVGAASVASSKADGYTIVRSSPDVNDTTESFQLITTLSEGGLLLVLPAVAPCKDIEDLVEPARKAPGKIMFTSSGAMGVTHLLAAMFSQESGIKLMQIPSQGSAPAITPLLCGHVDMASTAIAPAQAHLEAGTLRPLAVFDARQRGISEDEPLRQSASALRRKRLATADAVADAVVYLSSARAPSISGAILNVDGAAGAAVV